MASAPAVAQPALSSDARCFVVNVTVANSQKKKDQKLYDNAAMFFLGRLNAQHVSVADLDVDGAVREMSEDAFVADVKRCLDELSAALDTVGGEQTTKPD